jgi:antitoxin CcdA
MRFYSGLLEIASLAGRQDLRWRVGRAQYGRMENVVPQAPKKVVRLLINGDLLAKARRHNIDLSSALEQALTVALKQSKREQWLAENENAIHAYNEHLDKSGSFGDRTKRF